MRMGDQMSAVQNLQLLDLKKEKKKYYSTSILLLNIQFRDQHIKLYNVRTKTVSQILGISQRSLGQTQ